MATMRIVSAPDAKRNNRNATYLTSLAEAAAKLRPGQAVQVPGNGRTPAQMGRTVASTLTAFSGARYRSYTATDGLCYLSRG